MLRRIKKYLPKSVLEKVYEAIVPPYFDYCSHWDNYWDNCSLYLQDKLQKMQNRAARVITGKPYGTKISDILNMLHWQPLADRRKFDKVLFMYKVKNNQLPETLTGMFRINRNESYRLRSNYINYMLPKPKTSFMKRSISYSAVSQWNKLPNSAKKKGIPISKIKAILSSNPWF